MNTALNVELPLLQADVSEIFQRWPFDL